MASTSAYQRTLKEGLAEALKIAKAARKLGLDPAAKPEIHITKDLAERVEALIGVKGLSARIHELEKDGLGREEIALRIGQDFVEQRFGQFERVATIEHAVRTAVAILTEGVVAAPIEGIARVESDRNDDGTEYIKVFYSGPIRSAGGTAQALSVLAADYIRRQMGFAAYQPREEEIGRYVLEVSVYERIAGLQYKPNDEEIREIVKSCPICIDGDPTEEREVGGYMGLQRVATDRVRGGMVLVLTEGVAMKAPKIKRHVDRLGLEGWEWVTRLVKTKSESRKRDFLGDLIAGRPVFGRPAAKGAFRLRYGRARNTGLETVGLNPVTMSLLKFTAAGTQIKPELPGKAGCVVPVDSIEGPTVKLQDGSLVRLDDAETLAEVEDTIAEIIDLGEILIDYGDFLETGHRLMPGAYAHEWWVQELAAKSEGEAAKWRSTTPSHLEALELATTYGVPLHPAYTYLWEDLTEEDRDELTDYISTRGVLEGDTLLLPEDETGRTKRMLEDLLVPHRTTERKGFVAIHEPVALLRSLGLNDELHRDESVRVTVRSKGPTRIGMRMGRPEKSKERRMKPAPHSLFPVGEYGGKSRLLKEALKTATERPVIELEIQALGRADQLPRAMDKSREPKKRSIDLRSYYENTMKGLGEPISTTNLEVKCVKGLISKHKVAEHLGKGVLRAKHDVVVFKDGTIRYDFTNLPLTHFYPKEIGLSVEKARELGYTHDILGEELTNELQMLELKQQDLVISLDAASYLLRVSHFVDALLTQFYGLTPFYHAARKEDLIGHLVLGLAPHTSAGILSRIIGFTSASACYAHPFFHAAKRRNCLAPTTETILVDTRGVETTDLESLYRITNEKEEVIDDFGTTRKAVAGMKTYALNPDTGQFELKEITAVLKTPAPAHLLAVRTNSGRTWVSSPEHRMMVWSNGTVKAKKLLALTEGDKLLLPVGLYMGGEEREEIDLLEVFWGFDTLTRDIMVRGARDVVETAVHELGGLKVAAERIGLKNKRLGNYIYRDSIPLPVLSSLFRAAERDWSTLPRSCKLGVKRDNTAIPRIIRLDEQFMRLIGYYLAGGYARAVHGACYQISMASLENELRNDMETCIREVFGLAPSRSNGVLTISNRLLYHFFVDFLQLGTRAAEKRIPALLGNLPREKMKWLLRGYFSGDGSVEKNRLTVTCSSVSKHLLQDVGLQLLRFGIFYRVRHELKPAGGAAQRFYAQKDERPVFPLHYLIMRSTYARKFNDSIGFLVQRKNEALVSALAKERSARVTPFGECILDEVKELKTIPSAFEFLFDLEVADHHNFLINNFVLSSNCDGDEDSVLLLLDALLNFSLFFLPEKRGGKMDAPLVLIPFLNPKEVDKEAHNVSTATEYPLALYEAACAGKMPKEVEIDTAASKIEKPRDTYGFGYTHRTTDIAAGPINSLYKQLDTMIEKMEAELRLARMIRAVNETEVAETVIENHFLRDIKGNLRAFGSQKMRCNKCNTKYRRIPLNGVCKRCGGKIVPTVHAASIRKYLDVSLRIAEEYHVSRYTKQRLELLDKDIQALFPVALEQQKALSDFM
ncbi:MAG: DNA polymerase II large subunit [Candidatus Methanospirareceae archaeon]